MAAVIVIMVTVIIAQCNRVTSMITPANRNAAVIIVNRRRNHEFVIIVARQMGAQKWGICRTSSITEVVMQMKYTMGKEKTPH